MNWINKIRQGIDRLRERGIESDKKKLEALKIKTQIAKEQAKIEKFKGGDKDKFNHLDFDSKVVDVQSNVSVKYCTVIGCKEVIPKFHKLCKQHWKEQRGKKK